MGANVVISSQIGGSPSIPSEAIHILPKDFAARENTVDRMSDAAQTFGPSLVFASEITDLRSRSGIANF